MAEAPEELKFMRILKKDQCEEVTKKVKKFAVIARRGSTVLPKKHSDITMFFDKFIIDKMENKEEPLDKSYILCFYFLKLLKMLNDDNIFETTKIENKGRSFTAHTFADTISGSGVWESTYNAYKKENYEMLKKELEPQIKITDFDTVVKNNPNAAGVAFYTMLEAIEDLISESEKRKGFDKYDFPKVKSNIVELKLKLAPRAEKSTTSTTSTPTTSTATNRVADAAKGTSTGLNLNFISSMVGIGGKKSRKRCNKSKRKTKNNKTRKAKPKRKSRKNSRS